jgi:lipopolysaccharide assembly outer membrane protein LptD (OstA)
MSLWNLYKGIHPVTRLHVPKRQSFICLMTALFFMAALPGTLFAGDLQEDISGRVRTVIPSRYGIVTLTSDQQEEIAGNLFRAKGNVTVTFKNVVVNAEAAEYNNDTGTGSLSGHIRFSQKELWLVCSRAEFNLQTETGVFYDASGYVDREFFVTGRTIYKTGEDT